MAKRMSTKLGYIITMFVCPSCNIGVSWPNSWIDQDATWCGGRPRSKPHCVGWDPAPPQKGAQQPPLFGPRLSWPNVWMDQDTTWYGGRPWPRRHSVRWGHSFPHENGHSSPPTLFGSCLIVAKRSLISATAELLFTVYFGSRRASIAGPILTMYIHYTMCFRARKSLLGNAMRLLLIWGSDLPKSPFWGWIGIFKPNSKNSKTCIGLLSKLQHRSVQTLHSDKDHQMPFEGGPSTRIIQDGGWPSFWKKNRKIAISQQGF